MRRGFSFDELENEFSESFNEAYLLTKKRKVLSSHFLNELIDTTISMMMDGLHYKLYSTLPEDEHWYDNIYSDLKRHYKNKIIQKYNEKKGFVVIAEEANEIETAVRERKNFVTRTALSIAVIILIFSIFLNANIIKPIGILGRYTSKASSNNPDDKIIDRINLREDEIGNLSRSLSSMTNNLYQRIEFAERFASDLTHEIRNPLASLKAASELLPDAKDIEKRNRLLNILSDDVTRIERLITDYSKMLKGEALEVKLQLKKFDLIQLIKNVVKDYQEVINNNKKNISIEVKNLTDKKILILGFESRIDQVISNILENAVSFSPENSVVNINIQKHKNNAKIVITDEGPGFNETNIGKVFERFYSNRPKEMFGLHSGLGLNIVKNIVESHKGEIKAYNLKEVGKKGAAIEIDLPIVD